MDYDKVFSKARMASYRAVAPNEAVAEKLYYWNIELSAAIYESLMLLEVGMRNAIDAELRMVNQSIPDINAESHSSSWLLDPNQLIASVVTIGEIEKAKRRVPKSAPEVKHDDILAQMTFSSWRFLIPSNHSSSKLLLWNSGLKNAFSMEGYSVEQLRRDLTALNVTRNRIAHGEPILNPNLPQNTLRKIFRVSQAVDTDLARFIKSKQRITQLSKQRPK
jgi:hypothetical protein